MSPAPVGRAAQSVVRTPAVVRDLLLAGDPVRGQFITKLHQGVKEQIENRLIEINAARKAANPRARRKNYQWPRAHSFKSLIVNMVKLGLLERTGERESSDLIVARGLEERTFVRIVPGMENDAAWARPMVAIRQVYPNMAPKARPKRTPAPRLRTKRVTLEQVEGAIPPPPKKQRGGHKKPRKVPVASAAPTPAAPPAAPKKKAAPKKELTKLEIVQALVNQRTAKREKIEEITDRLDEMENPDTKRGEYLQERIDKLEEEIEELDDEIEKEAGHRIEEEEEVRLAPETQLSPEERKEEIRGLGARLFELGELAESAVKAKTTTRFGDLLLQLNDFIRDLQDVKAVGPDVPKLRGLARKLEDCGRVMQKHRALTPEKKAAMDACVAVAQEIYDYLGVMEIE